METGQTASDLAAQVSQIKAEFPENGHKQALILPGLHNFGAMG
jgi:hypothetical protein